MATSESRSSLSSACGLGPWVCLSMDVKTCVVSERALLGDKVRTRLMPQAAAGLCRHLPPYKSSDLIFSAAIRAPFNLRLEFHRPEQSHRC